MCTYTPKCIGPGGHLGRHGRPQSGSSVRDHRRRFGPQDGRTEALTVSLGHRILFGAPKPPSGSDRQTLARASVGGTPPGLAHGHARLEGASSVTRLALTSNLRKPQLPALHGRLHGPQSAIAPDACGPARPPAHHAAHRAQDHDAIAPRPPLASGPPTRGVPLTGAKPTVRTGTPDARHGDDLLPSGPQSPPGSEQCRAATHRGHR